MFKILTSFHKVRCNNHIMTSMHRGKLEIQCTLNLLNVENFQEVMRFLELDLSAGQSNIAYTIHMQEHVKTGNV